MAVGIDPNKVDRYVLPEDRKLPKEEQTIFLLKPLKHCIRVNLADQATDITGQLKNSVEFIAKVVENGLVGWDNFKTGEGADIIFGEKAGAENLSSLAFDQLNELAVRILELSGLTEGQKKK